MSRIQFANQFPAELASDLTVGAATIALKSGHGANFPEIANGADKYFMVAIVDKNGNREFARVIMRAAGSDTLVIGTSMSHQPSGNVLGRAQENTAALAITYTDDHVIELRLTAMSLGAIAAAIPASVSEMQTVLDPYPASVANPATDMYEVVNQLHYLIQQITGKTYWYVDPAISLETLSTRSIPSASIVLFESDSAIPGYTLLTNVDDGCVYITKGSGAAGEAGGTAKTGGTWTVAGLTAASHTHDLSNHSHAGPEHNHAGGSHTHDVAGNTYGRQASGTTEIPGIIGDPGAVEHTHYISLTSGAPSAHNTGNGGTGWTGALSVNISGGATASVGSAGTWRPPGRNFTRQQRN